MILSKEVDVVVSSNYLKYYKDLGYNAKTKELLTVKFYHLPKGSHAKIKVKCDVCSIVKEIQFRGYRSKPNYEKGEYLCRKCNPKTLLHLSNRSPESIDKLKKSLSNFKSKKLKEDPNYFKNRAKLGSKTKAKKTEEDPNYRNKITEKTKKTKLLRYGSETYNNQDKRIETLNNLYGRIGGINEEKVNGIHGCVRLKLMNG